jgi:hypothetical protein
MNPAQLRNTIELHGGVLNALAEDIRDEDIDNEELADIWYELQCLYENLMGDISEFEETLQMYLDEEDS